MVDKVAADEAGASSDQNHVNVGWVTRECPDYPHAV
jgi:hypothetical protein